MQVNISNMERHLNWTLDGVGLYGAKYPLLLVTTALQDVGHLKDMILFLGRVRSKRRVQFSFVCCWFCYVLFLDVFGVSPILSHAEGLVRVLTRFEKSVSGGCISRSPAPRTPLNDGWIWMDGSGWIRIRLLHQRVDRRPPCGL